MTSLSPISKNLYTGLTVSIGLLKEAGEVISPKIIVIKQELLRRGTLQLLFYLDVVGDRHRRRIQRSEVRMILSSVFCRLSSVFSACRR
jgi:hypothetical protein